MPIRPLTPTRATELRQAGLWQDRSLARIVADHARQDPGARAVTALGRTLTYADVVARVGALSDWLEELTDPGDVIALQSRGRADLLLLHLACSATDRVLMPLSHVFTDAENDHLLSSAQARVLVAFDADDRGNALDPAGYRRRHASLVAAGTPDGEGDFGLDEILARPGRPREFATGETVDRPHLAMVSSGSTQMPKVSVWTDNDLWFLLAQFAERVDLEAGDTALQIAPASTGSTGYVFPVLAPVLFGAHAVMLPRWSAAAALDALAEHGATVATGVPAQMVKMARLQQSEPRRGLRLRAFNNAGAKLGADLAREIEETLSCRIQTSYGASDGGVPVLTSIHDDDRVRHHTVGRTLPGVDLAIVGEDERPVPPGSTGEVRWRTPCKTFGYLRNTQQDESSFDQDGWYRSGDLGVIDQDGALAIVGRVREMIIRGGQNIFPGEIEEAVTRIPEVTEAAVLGLPDEVYGERTAAFVSLRPGARLSLEELCGALRAQGLATHKLPEHLFVVAELPHNNGGKVDKRALRAGITAGLRPA